MKKWKTLRDSSPLRAFVVDFGAGFTTKARRREESPNVSLRLWSRKVLSSLRRWNSGEVPEAGGARRWQTNPDLWYPVLLVVAGILFFSDFLFSSKSFCFRDILNFH